MNNKYRRNINGKTIGRTSGNGLMHLLAKARIASGMADCGLNQHQVTHVIWVHRNTYRTPQTKKNE